MIKTVEYYTTSVQLHWYIFIYNIFYKQNIIYDIEELGTWACQMGGCL